MKKITFGILFSIICTLANAQYKSGITVETLLKTDTTSIGQKIAYPVCANSEVTIAKVIIPPGKSTGWHKHLIPVFAYIQQGTLTVEIEGKNNLNFQPNSTFAEVTNTMHNGTNHGNEDVIIIAFYMGEKGKALSTFK